jgi:type II secretory pathway pseudopilin PulG
MKKAMTVMEIVIVLVMAALIFGLAVPGFHRMQERSLDKEPLGNLKRIQEAERLYHMEHNSTYYPLSSTVTVISTINLNLNLNLPDPNPNWNYQVSSPDGLTFTATAARNVGAGDDTRTWTLSTSDPCPTCAGAGCPPGTPCE